MRLKNQARGPVTLREIDFNAKASQETFAFTAIVRVEGIGEAPVRNDGRGGANFIQGRTVEEAVEAYAKGLPPHRFDDELSVTMDADLLITLLMEQAIQQKNKAATERKAARREAAQTPAIAGGVIFNWWVSAVAVCKLFGKKKPRHGDWVVLHAFDWGEVAFDEEEGIKIFCTGVDALDACIGWLRETHKTYRIAFETRDGAAVIEGKCCNMDDGARYVEAFKRLGLNQHARYDFVWELRS